VKITLILTLAATAMLAGCGRNEPVAAANPVPVQKPPAVAPAPEFFEASGPLVVENQVDVAAQRDGVIAKISVEVGQHVAKGQILAEFDARQLTSDRDAAEAKMRAIEADEKHWEEESKIIKNDLERDEEMFKAQLITEKQVEHSRYKVVSNKFEIQREQQNLRNAHQVLKSLQLELEKSRVVAPFDGVVARRYVRAGQRVMTNDRLFWVTAMSPVNVRFTVPQEFAGQLKRGEEVFVTSQVTPSQRHSAHIVLISPVVDPSSGAIEVEARLAENGPDLMPGMTVNIRVPKSR
jgi:membrane fusion protein (multidrug efflux system)